MNELIADHAAASTGGFEFEAEGKRKRTRLIRLEWKETEATVWGISFQINLNCVPRSLTDDTWSQMTLRSGG
jgi:hypothetical protein